MEFGNYFDFTICLIILILALKGIFSGFIREILSASGIVGGILIASRYSSSIAKWLGKTFNMSETLLNLFGFMIILAIIWITALVVAEVLLKFVKLVKLGVADKILGVFISGIKAFLILSVIIFTFSKINFISTFTTKLENSSFAYHIMTKIGDAIVQTELIKETKDNIQENITNSDNNETGI